MDYCKLKELWKIDEGMSFQGWDFSYLDNRWEEEKLPWDYREYLKKYLKDDYQLLDMGTGGGEFLLSLNHPYQNTSVTECWEPNAKLCMERLAPLGIHVHQIYDDVELPFEDNSFDMVINRHESYNVKEVKRILRPGGIFFTQQVGGQNNSALSRKLIKNFVPLYPHFDLDSSLNEFKDNSFEILYSGEFFPYIRFFDVGAVIYYAKVIEWECPGFSVDRCFEELCEVYEEIKEKGYFESLQHRFIIAARNEKGRLI